MRNTNGTILTMATTNNRKKNTIWGFPEEDQPAGEFGAIKLYAEFPRNQEASKLQAIRVKRSPWFIVIWEKLTDRVPRPSRTQVWCCYVRTVIFYKKGWLPDGKGGFARWAEMDHVLRCDDVIDFEGERFEVGTGRIVWYQGAWYSCIWARRTEKKY